MGLRIVETNFRELGSSAHPHDGRQRPDRLPGRNPRRSLRHRPASKRRQQPAHLRREHAGGALCRGRSDDRRYVAQRLLEQHASNFGESIVDSVRGESQDLDPRTVAALEKALSAFLSDLSAQWQMPAPQSLAPITSLTNWLVKYDRWRPHIAWFEVFEIVCDVFDRYPETRVDEPRKLRELLPSEHLDRMLSDLHAYLLGFPREYDLWIELPKMPRWGSGEISISGTLSIVEGIAPSKVLEAIVETSLRVYLRVRTKGYGSSRIETTAVAGALS